MAICNSAYEVFLARGPSLSGFPAWNRVLIPANIAINGEEILALADLDGEVITTPTHYILHLADAMPLTQARQQWDFRNLADNQTPAMRLWEALYACHPHLYEPSEHVLVGWWTPLTGSIIMGEAYLMGQRTMSRWDGGVDLWITGAMNRLLSPFEEEHPREPLALRRIAF